MATERHKYEYQVRPDSAAAMVIRMVGNDKRVLELGPGPGSITRHLHGNGCHVTALELDGQAIGIVAEFCEQVHSCNLNDPSWPSLLEHAEKFSAIVAADVLEHLYDPWNTLQTIRTLLSADGYVVISLPHVAHSAILACLLNENFEYQPWGLLDKTHIRFWGVKNIQKLFNDADLKIIEAGFVIRAPEQTEFASQWRKLSEEARKVLSSNPFGNVYQIVVRAVPRSAPGKAVRLESLAVPLPQVRSFGVGVRDRQFLGILVSFLSLRARARISRLLHFLGIPH